MAVSYETIQTILGFGMFTIALISLIYERSKPFVRI
ncbi:putative holin-like toxin [Enterococcus faecium]